jgi:hypothetical protein
MKTRPDIRGTALGPHMESVQKLKPEWFTPAALLAVAIFFSSESASAQKSTAKAGYFPPCYSGDIFTGTLSAVDDSRSEIVLTYTDSRPNRVENLQGEIDEEYTVQSRTNPTPHHLRPSELTLGKSYSAYYCTLPKKVNGKKSTINSIFLIDGVPNIAAHYARYMAF